VRRDGKRLKKSIGDCAKNFGMLRFSANGAAELELRRDSRRGKVMSMMVKYWQKILQMERMN
jgi:hypothetical protein